MNPFRLISMSGRSLAGSSPASLRFLRSSGDPVSINDGARQSAGSHKRQSGFTLIELLVAMMVFAVLGTVAYRGLFQIQRARDVVSQQSERLAELQRSFYWLATDMSLLVNRQIRTDLGTIYPALQVGAGGDTLLEFTRSGWMNPAADLLPPRSSLQRVAYRLDGDRLMRHYWYHLDRSESVEPRRRVLISGVDDVNLRYLDNEGEWHPIWPPPNAPQDFQDFPLAVEFELEIDGFGNIKRLFALPG